VKLGEKVEAPHWTEGISVAGVRQDRAMVDLRDVQSAFAYGDSVLAGERVRLRALRDDDLATLARWEMTLVG
jgi:hypothetical protein